MEKISTAGILIFILILSMNGGCSVFKEKKEMDKSSAAFLDRNLRPILSNLQKEYFSEFASPELMNSAAPEHIDRLFEIFGRLGAFKAVIELEGGSNINYNQNGKTVTARYIAKTEFENGPAVVKMVLINENENWQFLNFHIDSMALLDAPQDRKQISVEVENRTETDSGTLK